MWGPMVGQSTVIKHQPIAEQLTACQPITEQLTACQPIVTLNLDCHKNYNQMLGLSINLNGCGICYFYTVLFVKQFLFVTSQTEKNVQLMYICIRVQ